MWEKSIDINYTTIQTEEMDEINTEL